jgi:UDP-3-O-[3-hydroxymyristoyl] glucosamine N-acyltransferase
MEFSAKQIAAFLSGDIEGNPDVCVHNLSKIEEGGPGTLTFLANPKYSPFVYTTNASIILVNRNFLPEKPIQATLIRVDDAYQSLAKLLQLVDQAKAKKSGIHALACLETSVQTGENVYIGPFSYVGTSSKIGDNTQIFPHVYIGSNVKIGNNCILYAGVKICDDCQIGNNCIIQPGAVIGADGFGFAPNSNGLYDKIPQIGTVILEDNVEIGANTTIDRATMGATVIRQGVKLDNLIQIAHNVEIGANTVIAAQTGVAGSSKVGSQCMIGGQVGVAGHIHVGDHVQVGAQTGVSNSIQANDSPYFGTPAINNKKFARSFVVFKKLPDLRSEVEALRKELNELKNSKQK